MTEPVAGSGSCPAWIALVSKSIASILVTDGSPPRGWDAPGRVGDLLRAEPLREPADRRCDPRPGPLRRVRLGEDGVDLQRPGFAVVDRLDPPDQPVAAQDRQDVVPV